jgi:integrase
MNRGDIDLVHVIWGDTDQGVVSLNRNAIVFYTFAKQFGGHHSFIPTIAIEDKDFALIMDPVSKAEPDVFEATWDDVPRLLNHPEFPLMLAEFPQEIHLVQTCLGHSSVATTGKYLHARPTDSSSRYLPF